MKTRLRGFFSVPRVLLIALAFCLPLESRAAVEVRTAKVAGQFYPEEQAELLDLVTELIKRQPEEAATKKPRVLIVPHAGYQYSGVVAGNGFRRLSGHHYDAVVVVGFTHREQFEGVSVDTVSAYETPLGMIPVDQEAVAILKMHPGVRHVEAAHEMDEHSLEMELPFLQVALDRFRLVPILMGSASLEDARRLAEALAHLARVGDYLFVFSTDLSHYHPYAKAEAIDEATINAILTETPQAVHRLFARGDLEACGRGPILTSLFLAARLGYLKRELLYRANSGDTAGTPDRVVGYAAIAMVERPRMAHQRLSAAAGQALVTGARRTIERVLQPKSKGPHPISVKRYPELSRSRGIFVTLRKQGALRGCVGRIVSDQPLASAVLVVAREAALHDTRFPPVRPEELGEIDVEVSVLTAPAPLRHIHDLVAGRDGIILQDQGRTGVFLPQVWEETGWTRVEFLEQLASQKAGLAPEAWQRAQLFTFQDEIFEEAEALH